MNELWFVLGFLAACTLFLYAYLTRAYRRRNIPDCILDCKVLTYNKSQKENYDNLGVDEDPDEHWAPFIVDLRAVIAIKPPAEGDDFILLMDQSVIYTHWDSFVIDVPYLNLCTKWKKIKLQSYGL